MPKTFCRALALFVVLLHAPDALADCNPDPPSDDDAVLCDGTETGYDASGATGVTITTDGAAILNDSAPGLDSAILIGDESEVTIGVDATVNVDTAGGFGIRGNNDNFVDNQGTIIVTADDGRAISINDNTNGILPNGAINTSTIILTGDRSIGLETGLNSGVATTGTIEVGGLESRGISAADRTDYSIASDISNTADIIVTADGAIGIKTGDGWVKGTIVDEPGVESAAGIRNLEDGIIEVSGTGAFGIFAGDEANSNNNSFVSNAGMIDVTGSGAVGISLGGNDLSIPFISPEETPIQVYSLDNLGIIQGDADAGPLVEFRSFVSGFENQLRNRPDGQILAEPTNIAILGSDGDDLILNLGEIQGVIDLNGGDDQYLHGLGAMMTGTIDGGDGNDRVLLAPNETETVEFYDASPLINVETLEIFAGGVGWSLENTGGFTGLTLVPEMARLVVSTPLTLGGALTVAQEGILEIDLDGMATPLEVQGQTMAEGTLILNLDPGLAPSSTPYRVIDTPNQSIRGRFDFEERVGTEFTKAIYDASGLSILYQVGLVAVAQGSNQRAIAQHLVDVDAAGGASPDLQNLINEFDTSTGDLSMVLFALSPEVYDVHTTIVVEGGRRIANLLMDRPRECAEGKYDPWQGTDTPLPCHGRDWSPWLAGLGGFRDREKFSDHPRYDSAMGGMIVGIDARPLGGLDLTFAISSQRGTLNVAGAGESTVTLTDISGQAAWTTGPLRVQGVVSWGHGFHKDRRRIRASETETPLNSRGDTDHDSDRITIAAEVGYVFDVGPIEVEPIGGVDWAWVYQRPIHEDNAGGFGIRIASRDDDIGSINAGVRLSTFYEHTTYLDDRLEWMNGVWRPVIEARWRQMLEGEERDIKARFQGSPDSVSDFTITGREDIGGFEVATGVSFTPRDADRLQFDLRYEAFLSSHTAEHNLTAKVQLGF